MAATDEWKIPQRWKTSRRARRRGLWNSKPDPALGADFGAEYAPIDEPRATVYSAGSLKLQRDRPGTGMFGSRQRDRKRDGCNGLAADTSVFCMKEPDVAPRRDQHAGTRHVWTRIGYRQEVVAQRHRDPRAKVAILMGPRKIPNPSPPQNRCCCAARAPASRSSAGRFRRYANRTATRSAFRQGAAAVTRSRAGMGFEIARGRLGTGHPPRMRCVGAPRKRLTCSDRADARTLARR